MKKTAIIIFCIGLVGFLVVQAQPATLTPKSLLSEVNQVRVAKGVAPLKIDPLLNKSAQEKADDMAKYNYFEHKDSKGREGYTLITKYKPTCKYVISENLAYNEGFLPIGPEAYVDSWVGSPSHYKAMTDSRYTITGFGIAGNKVVEHFCAK